MLRYIFIVYLLAIVKDSYSKGVSEETQKLLLQMVANGEIKASDNCETDQANDELTESQVQTQQTGVKFQCPVSSEKSSPSSVHALRPEDIDVVGAIGDSYTAAFGAGATFLGPKALLEHRGLSFSVGGDETLETHVSIPNILKKYNPDVYGFSQGIGTSNSNMNVAVTGATSEDIESMVDRLIELLVDDPLVNMEEDWKLITVFLGGNDIFDSCLRPRFTPDHFKEVMTSAFNTLKAMIPRALVNVLAIPDVVEVKKMTGVVCDVVHMSMCPCLYAGEDSLKAITELCENYNFILEELTSSGDFDTDDFALVFQPSSGTSYVPVAEDGSVDTSFFAPDCLHLSRRGHASGAFFLWVNMLEPVNAKETVWSPTIDEYLPCPSSPYIYTNRNSISQNSAGSVSANKQDASSTAADDNDSLGGGVITAFVFLGVAIVIVTGYVLYRQIFKSRWSYERL